MRLKMILKSVLGIFLMLSTVFVAQGQVKYRFNEHSTMIEPASLMKDLNVVIDPAWLDNPEDPEDISRDITGYPFLVVGWARGVIETKTQNFSCDALNFFFVDQQLWYKEEGSVRMLMPDASITAVLIGDRRLVHRVLPDKGLRPIWVEQLAVGEGVFSLFKYHTARYVLAIPPKDSFDTGTKAKFVSERSLYMGSESSPLQLLPEKLADFLALFPDKAEEMKQFLAKNKIRNLRKEADVIKAMSYYNSL